MKKLIFFLLLIPSILFAQSIMDGIKKDNIIYCVDYPKFLSLMKKYNEIPFLTMNTDRIGKSLDVVDVYQTILFVNVETGSWTMVESRPDGQYCFSAFGNQLKIGLPQKPSDI